MPLDPAQLKTMMVLCSGGTQQKNMSWHSKEKEKKLITDALLVIEVNVLHNIWETKTSMCAKLL